MKSILSYMVMTVFVLGMAVKVGAIPQKIDLTEVQKKEEERRKKTEKSKVSVSDANINKQPASSKPSGFVQVEPASSYQPDPTTEKDAKKQEAEKQMTEEYWREQKKKIEDRIKELEQKITKLESEIANLATQHRMQTLPQERQRLDQELYSKTIEKDIAVKELEGKKHDLANLYEQARKAGVPPGWLR